MKNQQTLIDGENYVHGLMTSLKKSGVLRTRSQLQKINLTILFGGHDIDIQQARYYMTRIHMPKSSHKLYPAANQMRLWNKRWLPYHANQGVTLIRAGLLKVRDGKTCKYCGKSTEILLEKGVDVRLAVDILQAKGTVVYLFSSDSDLIPAILAAKKKEVKVVYVYIEGQKNYALQKVAHRSIMIANKQVTKAYRSVKKKGSKS